MRPQISVVIATSCEATRREKIRRAISSVLSQQGPPLQLLIIVNGQRYDAALFEELKADSRLKVHYRELGSFPAALKDGRHLAGGEFFTFLDDDDALLPGALGMRLEAVETVDWLASN